MSEPQKTGDQTARARELRGNLVEKLRHIDGPFFDRLVKCGKPLLLRCTGCDEPRDCEQRCKWKCCPVCQRGVTAASAARYKLIAKQCQWPLLVTFNAAHKKSDGVEAFREMRAALTRLRAQRWWKRRVAGGVACWEVSRLNARERKRLKAGKDNGWHFHCHLLIDCKWLYATTTPPRYHATSDERKNRIRAINQELAELWSLAMGGRKGSIDVRRVWYDDNGGIEGAVHEVVKYAMSGASLAESDYDIEPVLWALEKTRMVAGFGSFYRHPSIKRPVKVAAMCPCGCASWVPHEFAESTIALKSFRRRHAR